MSLGNLVLRRRGTGCLPHTWKKGTPDIDKMGIASTILPVSKTLLNYLHEIRDQGSANSCVAEAIAAAIDILEGKAGIVYKPISTYAVYWWGRFLSGLQHSDTGSIPPDVIEALRRIGAPDEQYWPRNIFKINKQPSTDAYAYAHPRRNGSYVVIQDAPDERTTPMRATLAAGFPIIIPLRIDRAFQQNKGSEIIDIPTGPIIGGHMQMICGYRWGGTQWLFRDVNSYGYDWRNRGTCEITEEFVCSELAGNPIIIHAWNALRGVQ